MNANKIKFEIINIVDLVYQLLIKLIIEFIYLYFLNIIIMKIK
jgi:hypothetical protein